MPSAPLFSAYTRKAPRKNFRGAQKHGLPFFYHPDYTVGPGFSPESGRPNTMCKSLRRRLMRLSAPSLPVGNCTPPQRISFKFYYIVYPCGEPVKRFEGVFPKPSVFCGRRGPNRQQPRSARRASQHIRPRRKDAGKRAIAVSVVGRGEDELTGAVPAFERQRRRAED